jgi:hypothetical protein
VPGTGRTVAGSHVLSPHGTWTSRGHRPQRNQKPIYCVPPCAAEQWGCDPRWGGVGVDSATRGGKEGHGHLLKEPLKIVLLFSPSLPLPPPCSLSLSRSLSLDWGLNSGLPTCKAGVHPRATPPSILLWLFWRWGLQNYLPSRPRTWILPIPPSQVAGITGVSHHAQPSFPDLHHAQVSESLAGVSVLGCTPSGPFLSPTQCSKTPGSLICPLPSIPRSL